MKKELDSVKSVTKPSNMTFTLKDSHRESF